MLTPQQIIRKTADGSSLYNDTPAENHRHIISVLLENSSGALNRVTNLFAARGFNLESVTVGETEDPTLSRMTIVTAGNDRAVLQIIRQLDKLIETLEVTDLWGKPHIEREICLATIEYQEEKRSNLVELLNIYEAKILEVTPSQMSVQLVSTTDKIDGFVGLMRQFGITKIARSGRVAISL